MGLLVAAAVELATGVKAGGGSPENVATPPTAREEGAGAAGTGATRGGFALAGAAYIR